MQVAATRRRPPCGRRAPRTRCAGPPPNSRSPRRASRDALTRQRVEQVRAWPIPDAASVVEPPGPSAERAARAAAEPARSRHAAGATSATDEIDRARQAVSDSETVAATIYLGPDRRLLADGAHRARRGAGLPAGGRPQTAARACARRGGAGRPGPDRAAELAARYADAATIARWQRWKRRRPSPGRDARDARPSWW